MGVLVKGMKMPASCLTCPHHEHGTIHEWELYCGLTGDYIGRWDDESLNNGHRPDTCPLVEIPTPHGRLIDVDAADEYAYDELNIANSYLTGWEAARAMQKLYQNSPTVNPASEE